MNKFSLGVLLLYFFSDPQSERAHLLSSPVPARSASIISLNIIHSHNFYAFPKSRIRIPTTSFRVRPVFCLCAGTLTEYTVIVFLRVAQVLSPYFVSPGARDIALLTRITRRTI